MTPHELVPIEGPTPAGVGLKPSPRYPSLYQINTRVRLTELSRALGRSATLDDFSDAELDRLAALGFDWIWLLSVWQTGPTAMRISRGHPEWRREFEHTLPDLREEDIGGSGFAISAYAVHSDLGGDAALARLRERLRQRGLKLMLDFVPNHVAPDHPWVDVHPEFFVAGSEADRARAPQNYLRLDTAQGPRVLAHGRDPYFDGWPDTLQLNYGNAALQQAMIGELQRIAGQCDGLRCDMAMLVVPEIFERTWGLRSAPFWPEAIAAVRHAAPGLQLHGRGLLGHGVGAAAAGLRPHLRQVPVRPPARSAGPAGARTPVGRPGLPGQAGALSREPRRAACGGDLRARGARRRRGAELLHARLALLSPGSAGRPPRAHLAAPGARPGRSRSTRGWHRSMRGCWARCATRCCATAEWSLLECVPAWPGNPSAEHFIAWRWQGSTQVWLCAAVNYSPHPAQCFVRLPVAELAGRPWRLRDLLGAAVYDRCGDDLLGRGLYLDLPPWGHHLFEVQAPG